MLLKKTVSVAEKAVNCTPILNENGFVPTWSSVVKCTTEITSRLIGVQSNSCIVYKKLTKFMDTNCEQCSELFNTEIADAFAVSPAVIILIRKQYWVKVEITS
jgi:hypothetical protein